MINGVGALISAAVVVIVTATSSRRRLGDGHRDAVVRAAPAAREPQYVARPTAWSTTSPPRHRTDPPPPCGAGLRRPLDMASARAISTRGRDARRAARVHFALDDAEASALREEWSSTGLHRVPLEVIDCPTGASPAPRSSAWPARCRRRDAGERPLPEPQVQGHLAPGPARQDRRRHPRAVSRIPHANVNTVPFHLDQADRERSSASLRRPTGRRPQRAAKGNLPPRPCRIAISTPTPSRAPPLGDVRWRSTVTIAGRVRSMRVARKHDTPLETCWGQHGRHLGGVPRAPLGSPAWDVGTKVLVEGTVGVHKARLALLNPKYQLSRLGRIQLDS